VDVIPFEGIPYEAARKECSNQLCKKGRKWWRILKRIEKDSKVSET